MLKKILIVLNLFLLAALVYMLQWLIPAPDSASDEDGLVSSVPAGTATENGQGAGPAAPLPDEYEVLVDNDLFGIASRDETPRARDIEPAPAEPLNITLLGTVAGADGLARAILRAGEEKTQGVYRIGDVITGAKIVEIDRKRVLLMRDGSYYELTMDMVGAVELEGEEESDDRGVLAAADFRDAVRVRDDGVIEVDRQEVLEKGGGMFALMRQVQENLQAETYVEDGDAVGLRLSGVDRIGVAQLAGIREGDVVRTVNGEAVSSLPKAMQMFRRVRHLDDVSVELQRDGKTVEMIYSIQ